MTAQNAEKTVLIADDDASIRTVLSQALKRAGYAVNATDNGATLFQWVSDGQGDLVITDVMMPGENGLDLIPKIHQRRPGMKVIVMSAQNALTTAISAAEKGALDYLPKPFDIDALLVTVRNAFRQPTVKQTPDQDNALTTADALDKSFVVGQSRAMREIYRTIARLRTSDLTVLMTGESGTGKEVIARALHQFSRWKAGPFVAINMAAIPRELIESELFGHEKGAFTGATQKTVGRFEQAQGGTLFLDEIGDMPFEAQTRLLRVLQEGEFTSVGGRKPVKTRLRIIAATNKNLSALVKAGKFREDLYYRLNVIPLHIPPLRERAEDIPALVQHFIARDASSAGVNGVSPKVFEPGAMQRIRQHPWPGNIRELENFTRRLAALCPQDIIDAETVGEELARLGASQPETALPGDRAGLIRAVLDDFFCIRPPEGEVHARLVAELEKPLVERVLQMTNGNQIRAAEILGLNRNTLRKKIRELDIEIRRS
ncbi:MAG: nitrogen regulation protein NR(I) [Alphaproteobacteria bacterium]|nr:nitrogen regulation protein NR(I) [Alphaproteobacteria bacterium]